MADRRDLLADPTPCLNKGDAVRIERDEQLWPSRGSWPQYRGRRGVVESFSRCDDEIGVWLGDYMADGNRAVVWFEPWELRRV